MSRVTSLTNMPEEKLNRWIKRIALLFVVVLVAFVAFYAIDRFRAPAPAIADQQLAAAEAAVQADPADIPARGRLADLYTANGRYQDAIVQYDAILESGKETQLAHFGRAYAYKGLGELDKAAADYQVVVDIASQGEMANVDPVLNAAYYGLGEIAMKQSRYQDAITNLEAAARIKRSDADTLNLLGAAYLAAGEHEKAVDTTRKAIAFVPLGWSEPYETLAAAYEKLGQADSAEWAAAMAEISSGQVDEAKTRLLALADGPLALDAAIGLGIAFESQNELTSAAEWYGKALAIDPENAAAKLGFERTANTVTDPNSIPGHPTTPTPAPSAEADGND
jgi:tetratricopeptide (TPR) repeat protein